MKTFEAILEPPQIEKGQTHKAIYKARRALLKICNELDPALAKSHILHCMAPTGSGKTLSVTTLATRIAIEEKIPRIIFATPYINLTNQTDTRLKEHVQNTAKELTKNLSKIHNRVPFPNKKEKQRVARFCPDVTICTTVRLHETLLQKNGFKNATKNLKNSVIIIDDAVMYLHPGIASAVLTLLNDLRKNGARVILSSATLPHYEKLEGYLPEGFPIYRFAEEIQNIPEIKSRCKIEMQTEPIHTTEIIQRVKTFPKPMLIICETVHKTFLLFNAIKKAISSETEIVLINAHQSENYRRAQLQKVEKILKEKLQPNLIVISTTTTQAGWDVSFASGIHDIFDTPNLFEHAGRINRNLEYAEESPLLCAPLFIPPARPNHNVSHKKEIAITLLSDNKTLNIQELPTKAAQLLLNPQTPKGKKIYDSSLDLRDYAETKDFPNLQRYCHALENSNRTYLKILPRTQSLPKILRKIKKHSQRLNIKCQIFQDNRIQIDDRALDSKILEEYLQQLIQLLEADTITLPSQQEDRIKDSLIPLTISNNSGKVFSDKFFLLTDTNLYNQTTGYLQVLQEMEE